MWWIALCSPFPSRHLSLQWCWPCTAVQRPVRPECTCSVCRWFWSLFSAQFLSVERQQRKNQCVHMNLRKQTANCMNTDICSMLCFLFKVDIIYSACCLFTAVIQRSYRVTSFIFCFNPNMRICKYWVHCKNYVLPQSCFPVQISTYS